MKKVEYNWWTDPKNKEEVEKHSWWNDEKNKETFGFPISITNMGGYWTVTCNNETEKLIGDRLHGIGIGKTKEEAITTFFTMLKISYEHLEERELNYQRFVPFRKGDWSHIGGTWFTIFGIHIYFRYGKGMKHGWYIPFTKLNISVTNEWKIYKKFKKNFK